MKTINLTYVFLAIIALFTTVSCVNDDDYTVPDLTGTDPVFADGQVTSVEALRNLFLQEGETVDLSDSTQYVEGYVISSDEEGNWFEEIIIQNSASEPTAGLRVLIDESPLFTYYEVGRKIYVKLEGLHLGESNGVLTLGVTENLEKIPAPLQFDYIERSSIVETIVPVQTTIADFSEDLENIFVQLTNVQFAKEEVVDQSLTFAGEATDEFDGERIIFSCDSEQTVLLSTSTFASFKSVLLPTGRGTISGVLTRNFFGDTFNLAINDLSDVMLEDENRCDPVEIDCGLAAVAGINVLFEDDFDGQTVNSPISGNGWTNFIEAGSEQWEAYSSTSNSVSIGISARVGAFGSGDASTISWLVTPLVDFTAEDGETLEFLTSNSFSDGSTLELLYSSDWDGVPANIPNATWDVLPAAYITQDDDNFREFYESGIVDLSCVEAAGYIAFRYNGSGAADFDGTYELEGVQIKAN
ncbi:DUF5689 domain-containing protein [Dokdonia sp. Hel_I_53]|uniref:DUF5689 domain-containing protein n=1 Tax=Dokdonia sp. Hel_I_53 TaxID=1566287 RepID=UPI00119C3AB9|nr:DUF5689 domain-containing protein [Dokdonia sp. Hel_I_53]TVZ52394.1 hypothetical protein OD90_1569 [Dokdonia sp. Hel_I_53]